MKRIIGVFLLLAISDGFADGLPSLPAGLGGDLPALPEGLGLPSLETQLDEEETDGSDQPGVSGYLDFRYGERLYDTTLHPQRSIEELRIHVNKPFQFEHSSIKTEFDLLLDEHPAADSPQSDDPLTIRKLSLSFQASEHVDIQMGRQVLTWGTGDMLFLNDFFPKDWRYLIGRDVEYSKLPSDAVKLSLYGSAVNSDLVYTPQFDPDRYVDGSRLSYFDAVSSQVVGSNHILISEQPDEILRDDEWAFRIYSDVNGKEWALYGYHGFFKTPSAYDPDNAIYWHSRLASLGFSYRQPLRSGILSVETAYWDSLDDQDGSDPLIANGETRYLLAYEQEIGRNLTMGLQYYIEDMHHYHRYLAGLSDPTQSESDQYRMVTLRLTQLLMNQDLKLDLFIYYSPSGDDSFARPVVNYRVDDHWMMELGANLFEGDRSDQLWAQLEESSNWFFSIRYQFDSEG